MTLSNTNINNLKKLINSLLDNRQFARIVPATIANVNPIRIVIEETNMELDSDLVTITWTETLDASYLNRKVFLIRQDKGGHYYAMFTLSPAAGFGDAYGNYPSAGGAVGSIEQDEAGSYDASKSEKAGPISTAGWNEAEVNQFNMNAADPPYIDGAYIDQFFRDYYPDSPLIGHGNKIKLFADYYGVAVGAAIGVWAKETTFGRGEPGRSYHNYGCMISATVPEYPKIFIADRNWVHFPSVDVGIGEWFRYVRNRYLDQGITNYSAFLDVYSPKFENNQATFKNLMWGALKAFGYDMSDNAVKKNYGSTNTLVRDLDIDQIGKPPSSGSASPGIETMVQWFLDRVGKVTYSMSARTGPYSYDCSSAVFSAMIHAGLHPPMSWLGTTETLFGLSGTLLTPISRSEVRRGDLFVAGVPGASLYAAGHTGVILDGNTIVHCTYPKNGIAITPLSGWTGSPVSFYRINR